MTDQKSNAKKTPLYDKHVELEAKIVDFAGYRMPVMYTSINAEHLLVRNKVGLFDLSHMGEFIVTGNDAADFIQSVTVNDVSALKEWQIQYSCMCYPDGGIVDDLLVYRLPDSYMLVVNAACLDKDLAWLKENLKGDVKIENRSDETGLIAIQGPEAENVLAKATDLDLSSIPFYWAAEADVCRHRVLLSRTGYTGEDGFELYIEPQFCRDIWDGLMDAGKDFDIGPVGLGARDSLRLEMKYVLYGNDISKDTNPIAAGLSWIVKLDKGDFIGKEAVAQMKAEKPPARLVAIEMLEKGLPRKDYEILNNDEVIGSITSGGYSPSLDKGIGLGYVRKGYTKSGTELSISIRGKHLPAVVVKPPLYKGGSHK